MLSSSFKTESEEATLKNAAPEPNESDVYLSRSNWPPYTYRDYPDIKPEAYGLHEVFVHGKHF